MPDDEEIVAWYEYLEAVRGLPSATYDEVEDWAWRRLRLRLKQHARRKAKVA